MIDIINKLEPTGHASRSFIETVKELEYIEMTEDMHKEVDSDLLMLGKFEDLKGKMYVYKDFYNKDDNYKLTQLVCEYTYWREKVSLRKTRDRVLKLKRISKILKELGYENLPYFENYTYGKKRIQIDYILENFDVNVILDTEKYCLFSVYSRFISLGIGEEKCLRYILLNKETYAIFNKHSSEYGTFIEEFGAMLTLIGYI